MGGMTVAQWLGRWSLALFFIVLLALEFPATGNLISNRGMLDLQQALYAATVPVTSRSHSDQILRFGMLPSILNKDTIALFGAAAAINPMSFSIRWGWGRALLLSDDRTGAVNALRPLTSQAITSQAIQNPFFFQDILAAYSYAGMPEQVLHAVENTTVPYVTAVFSNTVALAYLDLGDVDQFGEVERFDPGNLYANYQLMKFAQQRDDSIAAERYRERLLYYPLEALMPTDVRLLGYIRDAIPRIVEDGIWDRGSAARAISFLIWQNWDSSAVEELLLSLTKSYPDEIMWSRSLAELYLRRNRGTIESPLVAGERSVTDSLSVLRDIPGRLTADRSAVAEQLGIGAHQVILGENLVRNPGFEHINPVVNGSLDEWDWGKWVGADQNSALFFGGFDGESRSIVARQVTLWRRPVTEGVPPYSEFATILQLMPGEWYVLSFDYKTVDFSDGNALVFLGQYGTPPPRFTFVHSALPETNGSWQRWIYLGQVPDGSEVLTVRLALRDWGVGTVLFDNVGLRKVSIGY